MQRKSNPGPFSSHTEAAAKQAAKGDVLSQYRQQMKWMNDEEKTRDAALDRSANGDQWFGRLKQLIFEDVWGFPMPSNH